MNNSSNKSDPRARLVAETFHNDWAGGPAAAFARRAAAHARTRRTVRRVVVTGGAVAALALAFFISTRRPVVAPSISPVAAPAPVAGIAPSSSATPLPAASPLASIAPLAQKNPGYEIISDAEFEALLGDRPVLILPREREGHRIVLLAR